MNKDSLNAITKQTVTKDMERTTFSVLIVFSDFTRRHSLCSLLMDKRYSMLNNIPKMENPGGLDWSSHIAFQYAMHRRSYLTSLALKLENAHSQFTHSHTHTHTHLGASTRRSFRFLHSTLFWATAIRWKAHTPLVFVNFQWELQHRKGGGS